MEIDHDRISYSLEFTNRSVVPAIVLRPKLRPIHEIRLNAALDAIDIVNGSDYSTVQPFVRRLGRGATVPVLLGATPDQYRQHVLGIRDIIVDVLPITS